MAEPFSEWCVVEIMGHQRYWGRVTEQTLGGASFIRVDVPNSDGGIAYSKIFGASSIYCITPCTEAIARAMSRPDELNRELSRLDFSARTREEITAGRQVLAAKALPTLPVDGDPGDEPGFDDEGEDYDEDA